MNTHTKAVCTACGSVGYPKKAVKGSSIIELAFWVFAIAGLLTLSFPGPLLGFILLIFAISYSLWRIVSKYHACRKCGQATVIPVDTPMGRKSLPIYRQKTRYSLVRRKLLLLAK